MSFDCVPPSLIEQVTQCNRSYIDPSTAAWAGPGRTTVQAVQDSWKGRLPNVQLGGQGLHDGDGEGQVEVAFPRHLLSKGPHLAVVDPL
jgi:hypothetical protein